MVQTTESYEIDDTTETNNRSSLPFKDAIHEGYKYVLPRAAYYDQRKIHGHKNAIVILVHMSKEVLKKNLVVGCIVNDIHAKKFSVMPFVMNGWIHGFHPHLSYDDVMVFCYDTPINIAGNNSVAIEYKHPKDNEHIVSIQSEGGLFIPSFEPANKARSSVMVCITAYGTPPCFKDWLHYQKTLGVDLVYINAQESFMNSTVYSDAFFQESLSNGFVQVKVWNEYLSRKEVFYHSQLLYYHDCLYRFQGVYNYAIILDTDEFYVTDENIHPHLDELFSKYSNIGALRLDEVIYHAPVGGFNRSNKEISKDGNLPRYAVREEKKKFTNFKSVCKLAATVELSVHTIVRMMPGFREYKVPKATAYIAHMK